MTTSDGNGNSHNNGKSGKSDKGHDWPTTVDETVDHILAGMPEEDKQTVRSTPKADLIMFHHGWGTGIRNGLDLWGGNAALLQSCAEVSGSAFMDADEASGVIIEAVWRRLQEER